jgi:hypothetical protein
VLFDPIWKKIYDHHPDSKKGNRSRRMNFMEQLHLITFTAAKVGIRREFDEVVCKHEANRAFITFAHHTTPP